MNQSHNQDAEIDMKQHIHESNLIEGYNDPEFDKQSMVAWKFLKEQKVLAHFDIMQTQKIIVASQDDLKIEWRGQYRKIPVWVGGVEAPFQIKVPDLMRDWIDNVNAQQLTPKQAHIQFEHIHPFVDGNGRTGRMLMWWHEIKRGSPPTLILNSKKQDYYRWFK